MAAGLHTSLERFVPTVATEWELDASDARWQERDGTLCFVDISGFTSLSERLAMRGRIGVEELTEVLNTVFGTMLDLAWSRGGSLLKFGGDALLLFFDGPDHPSEATSAAVEMRTALRVAAEVPMSIGRVRLQMSVGLHSGPVHLFRVGSLHHELVVAGPAATRTTLMEHAASAGDILVSPELAARLPRDATRPGPPGTMALRWRRARGSPTGARDRRFVPASQIDTYIPDSLREHLATAAIEFEHRIAAVAFLRFRGVDALLQSDGPDAVADALDATISAAQVAANEEGLVFLATDLDEDGGKVIIVGGVPRAQADDEGRILRTVRSIAGAGSPLPMQIGVNRGHVFAGTIGTDRRATFTVMGDTVNLAARLMSAAEPGQVLATSAVLDRSRRVFATEAVPPFLVKGKALPVHAQAVGEEVGPRAPAQQHGPFVGRADALQRVLEVLSQADARQPALLTIVGETGVGKSRLMVEALAAAGISAFTARGEPDGTSSPYRALRDPLRALLGIERGDQPTMLAALTKAVTALDPTLVPLLPHLGVVAHIDTPSTPSVDAIEPQFLPEQRAAAVMRLLDLALGRPATVVVEDAQWTDDASDHLLSRLAGVAGRHAPWSLVVLRRAVEGGFDPPGPRLELGVVDDAALKELLTATTTVPLRPDEISRFLERAAGSPLVLGALVRLGRERGAIDDLPESLEALLAAEIDVLPSHQRLLLRYASVLGRTFNRGVWHQLLAADDLSLDEVSTSELQRFLELGAGEATEFRQAVVRDVAYRGLSYQRRKVLHLRAGAVIERLANGATDEVADRLSWHFFEGGDHRRAWRYAREAGERAQTSHANGDAAALYRRALEAGRRLKDIGQDEHLATWTALGDVLAQAGLLGEAIDAYRRASSLVSDDDVERARLLLKRARVRERSGAFVPALRELRAAERIVADAGGAQAEQIRVAAATMRAVVHEGQEQPMRALRAGRIAAAEAMRIGDLRELASAYGVIDWAHVVSGALDQAVHQSQIVEIYESLGEPHRAAAALGNQGAVLYWQGRWSEAMQCYERAYGAYRQTGDVVNAAIQQANIAELLINRRQHARARPAIVEATQTHRAVGFVDGALFDEIQLGRLHLGEGDREEAARLLTAVLEESTELGLRGTALQAATHLAECRVGVGSGELALAALAEAEELAGSEGAVYEASVALVRSRALAQQGDLDGARRERDAGISAARRMGQQFELGQLLLLGDGEEELAEGSRLLEALEVDPSQLTV